MIVMLALSIASADLQCELVVVKERGCLLGVGDGLSSAAERDLGGGGLSLEYRT